jgi:HlyD family secretion protein
MVCETNGHPMDIKREGVAKKKTIRRVIYLVLIAAVVAVASWRVSLLKPAVPVVEASTIWPDTVKRGPMVREVRGLGTLVPEDIQWIQAEFDSQVKRIRSRSGDDVKPNTILLVLSNPQMEADAVDYEWQAKQAEANLADLRVRLQSQTFDQQSVVSTMQGELKQASITKDKEEQLFKAQLEPEVNLRLSEAKWEQASSRFQMEKQKLDIMKDSVQAQIDSQKVQIEKLRATYKLKKQQVDDLTIRAGIRGRIQEMTLQVGQRLKSGEIMAKIAQPRKLLARLQIPETQAKDIVVGLPAQIDTRNGIVRGHVVRIDASIVNGTRTVDCKLDGALPKGAVPDLSVDGTVELERIADTLTIGRPVFAQPNSPGTLFRIDPDGKGAERVAVRFGRASVNAIEVAEGLKAGDRVILSDMAAQDQASRVRLN